MVLLRLPTMPVGRIDDEDDELVDDSLNAGLLPSSTIQGAGAQNQTACSRPICFGVLLIGLLAFGVRAPPPAQRRAAGSHRAD